MKKCARCLMSLPLTEFSKLSRAIDGFNYSCKQCNRARATAWLEQNRERNRANCRAAYYKNPKNVAAKVQTWRIKNRAKHNANNKRSRERNPATGTAARARRRAQMRKAAPVWLTKIQRAQMREIYDVAAALSMQTGVKYHVDHVHPLRGEYLCGLHVPWNLQILTAAANQSKHNRFVAW